MAGGTGAAGCFGAGPQAGGEQLEWTTPIELEDVLVGEVWLASGQSNMDFTVAKTAKYYFAGVANEAEEVAAAIRANLHMSPASGRAAMNRNEKIPGYGRYYTPDNVREFSAVGYFFARELQKGLDVPVGIVTLTYGASTAQAWIRREATPKKPRVLKARWTISTPTSKHSNRSQSRSLRRRRTPPRRPKPKANAAGSALALTRCRTSIIRQGNV